MSVPRLNLEEIKDDPKSHKIVKARPLDSNRSIDTTVSWGSIGTHYGHNQCILEYPTGVQKTQKQLEKFFNWSVWWRDTICLDSKIYNKIAYICAYNTIILRIPTRKS